VIRFLRRLWCRRRPSAPAVGPHRFRSALPVDLVVEVAGTVPALHLGAVVGHAVKAIDGTLACTISRTTPGALELASSLRNGYPWPVSYTHLTLPTICSV